jgi:MFS family permease
MSSTTPAGADNELRSSGAAHPSRAQLTAWRNALFVIFALCGIGLASWAARIPAVGIALQLNTAQVGILLFGIAVGSIVGLIASGHLVATFGAKAVILLTLLIGPIGLVVAAVGVSVFASFPLSIAGLIIFGAATGTCDVAMNVSGAANERAIGRTIMPIYHAFFSAGTIVGAGLGALAEAMHIPLEIHIGALAILLIALLLWSIRYLLPEGGGTDHAVKPEGSDGWRTRLATWRDPRTLLIGLIVLGMAFTEGSANDWLSYAMVHGHHTDRPTGAVVFGVFVTAMTIGRLSGVKLLDRFGRVPVLRGSAALAAVGLLILIFVPIVWVAVVGVVLWGLGASLGFPVGMSAAADDPRKAAARVSAVATIGYVAFLVGPPVIGFLGNQFGILNGLLLVLVLVALAGSVSFAAREPVSAPATAPTPLPAPAPPTGPTGR